MDNRDTWTRNHFGVDGELTLTNSQEIFDLSEGFNVPNLRNASGPNTLLNVGVRLLASLGLPFLEMVRESLREVSRPQSLNVPKRDALQELLKLLDNADGYDTAKNPGPLRQRIYRSNYNDLNIVVVVLRLLDCLDHPSQDRFKSFVELVRVCPRPNCRPHAGANYQTLNCANDMSEVSIYVWSRPDFDYNGRHDDYQQARIADFDEPSHYNYAGSFRNVGDARKETLRHCFNPQCDVNDNPDGVQCRAKELLNVAKPVAELPRWQFINCSVAVSDTAQPNNHDDARRNFDALKVTPHATLDLHGFYEKTGNSEGPPTWNTEHSETYKLRGYVLLSSLTYRNVAWRTSFAVGDSVRYLHCDDKGINFISEEEYKKPDQKITLLVYETGSASTSSECLPDPPQPNRDAGAPMR